MVSFNIEKEVAAGLESIIPRAALGPFISLNPSEKVIIFYLYIYRYLYIQLNNIDWTI